MTTCLSEQTNSNSAMASVSGRSTVTSLDGESDNNLATAHAHRAKQQVASQFSRSSQSYDQAARIQQFSALELVKQLSSFIQPPDSQHPASQHPASQHPIAQARESGLSHWLDLGCGTGFAVPTLIEQGIQRITGADLAHGMSVTSHQKLAQLPFHAVTADAENLPFASACFDGIYSNLMVQWSEQVRQLFSEASRVIKPGGLFAFATLGPRTMHELKSAWQQVDPFVHVNSFSSKSQVINDCEQFFDIESCQQQEVVQHHKNLSSLLKELKAIGATNVNPGRRQGLGGRERLRKLDDAYRNVCHSRLRESAREDPTAHPSQLSLTYDLIWVIARKREF